MTQDYTEFHSNHDKTLYEVETQHQEVIDLEQVDQFQPETAPRSTTTAMTDLYTSSQIESSRYRDQGDPNEYSTRFEDR